MVTDQGGNIVWQWDNDDPFGDNIPNQSPNGTGNQFIFNLRFPGQYYDIETGTHYNYFRDFDPSTGRYVESDPIGLGGGQSSTYAYVNNQPDIYFDSRGLQAIPYFPPTVIPPSTATPGGQSMIPGPPTWKPDQPFFPSSWFDPNSGLPMWTPYNTAWHWWDAIKAAGKPPKDAYDPNGAKAPGKPGKTEGFCEPKPGKPQWGRNPNGNGSGWIDSNGNVWVPTGPDSGSTGDAHGGPHWDVQQPGGDYTNVYPGGKTR